MSKFLLGLRVFLGGLFIFAGLTKAYSSDDFALALVPFTFVPPTWLGALSIVLPILEIVAGLLILLPWTKRLGALLILLLSLIFALVLGWALANGIIVSCACFGQDETPSAAKMIAALVRDLLIIAAAAAVLFRPPGRTRDSAQKTPANG